MAVKDDERELMSRLVLKDPWVALSPRDIAEEIGMCEQRARFIFRKWECRGWYEYGVALDLGWLTPAGCKRAAELAAGL